MKPTFRNHGDRDRVLSDSELKAIWQACEKDGWPFGRITQLLILTGQRLREVSEVRWSELDLDNKVWHLPAGRAKNHNDHDIPLSDQAVTIIRALPHLDDKLVFPGRDRRRSKVKPLRGYPTFKTRLDAALPPVPPLDPHNLKETGSWVLHDIRRTVATGLQKLKIPLEVTVRILNHVSGSRGGIVGVYQRHDFADEKRATLDAWGRYVEALANPEAVRRNVV